MRTSTGLLILAGSLVYWAIAGTLAAHKPIWYDEALTWHIARLPSAAAIMATLYDGADQNLPLTFFSVRATQHLFGYSEWSTRLPALTGFWVMLVALFVFLRRRLPASCAVSGAMLPAVTYAWPFAFEARGYALLLGAGALALACWQAAADGRRRRLALPLLSVCLAIALSSHYVGALLAIPLTVGELVRSYQRRRIDWGMLLAFAVAAPLVLFYPGLMAPTRGWDLSRQAPTLSSLSIFYAETFYSAISPLLVATFCALAILYRDDAVTPPKERNLMAYEVAALTGFLFAPLLFYAAGIGSSNFNFAERYGVTCVIGAGGLLAGLLNWTTRAYPRAATVFAAAFFAWILATHGREAWHSHTSPEARFREGSPILVQALSQPQPVLVAHWNDMVQADFYLPAERLENAWYVRDRSREAQYPRQVQVNEVTFRAARHLPWHGHFAEWRDFSRQHSHFLLHTRHEYNQWIFDLLAAEGWQVTMLSHAGTETLFQVDRGIATP